jgi:CheY-like chemotaxis protein
MKPYLLIAQPNKQLALDYAAIAEELGLFPVVVPSAHQALDLVETWGAPALAIVELSLPPVLEFLSLTSSLRTNGVPVLAVGRARDVARCSRTIRAEIGIDALLGHTAPLDAIRCAAEALLRLAAGSSHGSAPGFAHAAT